jgi:hypothetical protein
MIDEYFEPSSSRVTRVASGVLPLKNSAQFVLITEIAAAPLAASPEELALADAVGAAVAVADAVADAGADVVAVAELVELLELLEQAVTAAANARPSTGASRTRRAV